MSRDANEERLQRACELIERAKDLGFQPQEVADLCYEMGVPRQWFDRSLEGQEELDL